MHVFSYTEINPLEKINVVDYKYKFVKFVFACWNL